MWELDYKESWAQKNGCFWTVVLEKTLESPLDCKEIQPVHPEGDQSWVFIGRTDVEAETPILCPPDAKSWLIGKDPDAGKDWRQEEKGITGWDSWMAPLTQWTWVWVNSGSWWWTGRPGVLQPMGSQRVGHDWATELSWKVLLLYMRSKFLILRIPCSWKVINHSKEEEGLPWWLRWWRICVQCRRPGFNPWVRKTPWRRKWQPTPVCLGNPMDRGDWWAPLHAVTKS